VLTLAVELHSEEWDVQIPPFLFLDSMTFSSVVEAGMRAQIIARFRRC